MPNPNPPRTLWSARLVRTLMAIAIYTGAYPWIRSLGHMGPALSLVPLSYIGYLWGRRAGALAGLLVFPYHMLLNWALGHPGSLGPSDAPGIAVSILTAPVAGWFGTLHRRLEAQTETMRANEARLRTIFSQLPALLWTTDEHLVITSGMGARPTSDGLGREEQTAVVGKSVYDLFGTQDPLFPPIKTHLDALQGVPGTYQNELSDHHYECHIEPFHDAAGRIIGTIGIALDVSSRYHSETALKRSEERLRYLASHDLLTRLPNRRRFQEELDNWLAATHLSAESLALLFFDVDGFKYVNDSLGHQAGDDLLKNLAALLRTELAAQPGSFIARLGGDEFGVLLPGHSASTAVAVAEQLVRAVRKHAFMANGQPIVTTISMGVAIYPDHGQTGQSLLSHADLAMYQTKERGRNGFTVYDPDQGSRNESEQKLAWEARIRQALDQGRFVLHAQPIQTLVGGGVSHYELLLRMLGEDGELILPGAFLDVAEKFGLIREIDRWVVTHAIRLSAELERTGRTPHLSVNLSGKAFSDPELLPLILQEFGRTNADPSRLIIEITETALITDITQAGEWVHALRQVGCKFAIDDFGAGFSSFSHLRRLPLDYLKIDGSYIRRLPQDEANHHLVRSMVEMARGLGMQTVAEFVGDEATVRLIRSCGVDYGQGYFLGKPAPLDNWWPGLTEITA